MKQYTILSRHSTLAEAVAASGMDLSYNEQSAAQKIKDIDNGYYVGNKTTEAFVTDCGVFYIFECDIRILNKFEPFFSTLSDSPFSPVVFDGDKIWVNDQVKLPKDKTTRKLIAKALLTVEG